MQIKRFLWDELPRLVSQFAWSDPIWQRKFYPFHLYSEKKLREKLDYMHLNPVRAGLVEKAIDRPWSSARYYALGKSVGVPIQWVE